MYKHTGNSSRNTLKTREAKMPQSITEAFRLFGTHMTDLSKEEMIYRHVKSELKRSPKQEFTFTNMAQAIDLWHPSVIESDPVADKINAERSSMLQRVIARLHAEGRLQFNIPKTKFQHKEKR